MLCFYVEQVSNLSKSENEQKAISTHRQVANLSYISDIYGLNHQQNNILHDSDCR